MQESWNVSWQALHLTVNTLRSRGEPEMSGSRHVQSRSTLCTAARTGGNGINPGALMICVLRELNNILAICRLNSGRWYDLNTGSKPLARLHANATANGPQSWPLACCCTTGIVTFKVSVAMFVHKAMAKYSNGEYQEYALS